MLIAARPQPPEQLASSWPGFLETPTFFAQNFPSPRPRARRSSECFAKTTRTSTGKPQWEISFTTPRRLAEIASCPADIAAHIPVNPQLEDECSSGEDDFDDDLPTIEVSITKKRVRFADTDGRPLFTIRAFSESDFRVASSNWSFVQAPAAHLGSSPAENAAIHIKEPDHFRPVFSEPVANFMDFQNKLDSQNVALEGLICSGYVLKGTIRVKNICFNKKVFVRMTFDRWRSQRDFPCEYLPSAVPGQPRSYDHFQFSVTVPHYLVNTAHIEFAVCFLAESTEYWDSNRDLNYRVERVPTHSLRRFGEVAEPRPYW